MTNPAHASAHGKAVGNVFGTLKVRDRNEQLEMTESRSQFSKVSSLKPMVHGDNGARTTGECSLDATQMEPADASMVDSFLRWMSSCNTFEEFECLPFTWLEKQARACEP